MILYAVVLKESRQRVAQFNEPKDADWFAENCPNYDKEQLVVEAFGATF